MQQRQVSVRNWVPLAIAAAVVGCTSGPPPKMVVASPGAQPADSTQEGFSEPTGETESEAFAAPGGWEQLKTYFGSLHSHTAFSDGEGTPREAFTMARKAGLDFFAITEHSFRPQDPGENQKTIATEGSLYRGTSESLVEVATGLTEPGQFVALYGQEWSLVELSNHINVFEVPEVIDDRVVKNGDIPGFLGFLDQRFGGSPYLLQLNHPGMDDESLEYGRDDYDTTQAWVSALDTHAQLIEVLNGPSLSDGTDETPNVKEEQYLSYLNLGFHLGATANQDNHHKNWGTLSQARTGVVMRELTKEALLAALRERHTFASEDKNLTVILWVAGALMGSEIACPKQASIPAQVVVFDPDEPEAKYEVQLYGDLGPGGQPAAVVDRITTEQSTSPIVLSSFPPPETASYFFAKVTQTTGDDTDELWTAPVWLNCSQG